MVDELDCAPFDPSVSACPDTAPGDDNSGGTTGGSVAVGNSGSRGVSGGGPLVTSLPSTGVGAKSPLEPLAAAMGIALALLALAGIRGWLHPVRVPEHRP